MKIATLLLAAVNVWAHHSMAAVYNDGATVTIQGAVTKFDWVNPHVLLQVNGWRVEFASRTELRQAGWNSASLHVGDVVTIRAARARDGSLRAHAKSLILGNGMKLALTAPVPTRTKSGKAAPRWPDGHPRLGPVPGEAGHWIPADMGDLAKGVPFQPWAKALYDYRQRTNLKDDPMAACLPAGGPRQFQAPLGVEILEDPTRARVFVLARGSNRNWRNIDLDGRTLAKGADVTPTYFGYSVGKWDGDVLVVESVGLIERFWFLANGMPHTESAKLTERIRRVDYDTLRYEVTVNDAGAYTAPWSASWDLQWVAGDDVDEYFCDDYNQEH